MKSVCTLSKHLTSLESHIIYVGKLNKDQYNCPDGICAEVGSSARPARNLQEAFQIIEHRFTKDIPVTIEISPGIYISDKKSLSVPKNVSGIECPVGSAVLQNDLIVKNMITLKLYNIDLDGSLEVTANGDHIGDLRMSNGVLRGDYTFVVKQNAKQTVNMQTVTQIVPVGKKGRTFANSTSVFGSGIAILKLMNNDIESPTVESFVVKNNGTLIRQIQNCTIVSVGESVHVFANGNVDSDFRGNTFLSNPLGEQEATFDTSTSGTGKVVMNWSSNSVEANIPENQSLYQIKATAKSKYDLKFNENTYVVNGNGMFWKSEINDQSVYLLESFRTTLTALQGTGPYYMETASGTSYLYKIIHDNNIMTPFRTSVKNFSGQATSVVSCFHSRMVSAGNRRNFGDYASFGYTGSGNYLRAGSTGYFSLVNLNQNSRYNIDQNDSYQNLTNILGQNIFQVNLKDTATLTSLVSGIRRNIVLKGSTTTGVQPGYYSLEQTGASSSSFESYNTQTDIVGGQLRNTILKDTATMESSSAFCSLKSTLVDLEGSPLYSLISTDSSTATITGSNSRKKMVGGQVSSMELNGDTVVTTLSSGGTTDTESDFTAYAATVSGNSSLDTTVTSKILKSLGEQDSVSVEGSGTYSKLLSNNRRESFTDLDRVVAGDGTNANYSSEAELLTGNTKFLGGGITVTCSNLRQNGSIESEGAELTLNSVIQKLGNIKSTGGSLTVNLSNLSSLTNENIDLTDCALSMNNTVLKAAATHNLSLRATVSLSTILQLLSFKNDDDSVSHVSTSGNGDHVVEAGILSTTSRKFLSAENPDKVQLLVSSTFNNSTEVPVIADATVVQRSNTVE